MLKCDMTINSLSFKRKPKLLKCNSKRRDVKEIPSGKYCYPDYLIRNVKELTWCYREMLDGAQRMIAELKADPNKKVKSGLDEVRSREVTIRKQWSICEKSVNFSRLV